MVNIFQNSLSGTIQDVPQNEALRTPDHVVLSELLEGKVTLKESCASSILAGSIESQPDVLFRLCIVHFEG